MVSRLTDSFISLGPDVAMSLVRQRQQTIRCIEDHLWLTQEGMTDDVLLAPGDAVTLSGRGRIVVQAVRGRARFILSIKATPVKRFRRAMAALLYRLADAIVDDAGKRAVSAAPLQGQC